MRYLQQSCLCFNVPWRWAVWVHRGRQNHRAKGTPGLQLRHTAWAQNSCKSGLISGSARFIADLWHQSNKKPQEVSGKSGLLKIARLMTRDVLPPSRRVARAVRPRAASPAKGSSPSRPNPSDVKETKVHGGTRSWLVRYQVFFDLLYF